MGTPATMPTVHARPFESQPKVKFAFAGAALGIVEQDADQGLGLLRA